jgi:hypothetical protein
MSCYRTTLETGQRFCIQVEIQVGPMSSDIKVATASAVIYRWVNEEHCEAAPLRRGDGQTLRIYERTEDEALLLAAEILEWIYSTRLTEIRPVSDVLTRFATPDQDEAFFPA